MMTGYMDRKRAEAHIRFLAEADRIAPLPHALVRSPEAGKYPLTREQMKLCLLKGALTEGPVPDIREAEGWKFTMRRVLDEERYEVAGVLIVEKKVLVITGYGLDATGRRKPKRRMDVDDDE